MDKNYTIKNKHKNKEHLARLISSIKNNSHINDDSSILWTQEAFREDILNIDWQLSENIKSFLKKN